MFRTFILLGAFLVLLLFVALLAPYWIDWKQFTREFETEASRVIGQPVKVGGSSNLRLLPLPYISFEDLEVGRNSDGSPLMTVERFSLNAELFPFLSGEVRIVEMEMRQPHINLQIEENGTVAWTSPSEPVVDLAQVKIEKLTVIDGSAELSGFSGGRTLAVEGLRAEFS
ncbi:MAG: AsmA family protein, partial [Pseudomonadota bacterium]